MQLQKLNPTTDPGYDELFAQLVQVDGELRRLRQGTRSCGLSWRSGTRTRVGAGVPFRTLGRRAS